MGSPQAAPYGSWKSPITSNLIVSRAIGLGQVWVDGADLYWEESRPTEGGRTVLVHRAPDGRTADVTPMPYNVRTRVHEYGGGAYAVAGGTVYFQNFADQHLYMQPPGQPPRPLHAEPGQRYADFAVDQRRRRLVCVREDHTRPGAQPVNTIVSLDLDGDGSGVLVSGSDFYASPRLSPDGAHLAWLAWDHPNMPWDGTELWVAPVAPDGALGPAERVAGGPAESVFQPEWSPDGVLHFVSDRTGWWNLYRWEQGAAVALLPMAAEFGLPQWVFNASAYAFASAGQIVCLFTQGGTWHLATLDVAARRLDRIELPYTVLRGIKAGPGAGAVLFRGGSATEPYALVRLDLTTRSGTVLRRSTTLAVNPGYLSVPRPVEFPTENGLTAHGLFYPPCNQDYAGLPDERPPLLVMSHGGPTSATEPLLNLEIQFWTSRGIAVLDVNYGGSTGYGRAYRERLNGTWGVVDVEDCAHGARYLVARGEADPHRLAITGGSAGGYTTLCALTFRDEFRAGASHFGVSDLAALAGDTHKFESRYLDRLVGPYPEQAALYRARSPVHFTHRLACPVIFFQGLDDRVVPPNQAETMVQALRDKGVPVAYLPFEGEGHGFRKAENIKRALDAELYFYSRVFGFALADPVQPVFIENL